MPVKRIVWRCSYCNKHVRAKKSAVTWHEERCFKNPESRSCITCEHLDREVDGKRYCEEEINIEERLMTQCKKHKSGFKSKD